MCLSKPLDKVSEIRGFCAAPFSTQGSKQILYFLLYLFRCGCCTGNFLAQQVAETMAQTMQAYFEIVLAHFEVAGRLGAAGFIFVSQEWPHFLKNDPLARGL